MSIISKLKALRMVIAAYDATSFERKIGYLGESSYLRGPVNCANPKAISVGEHSHILGNANYIIREGRFVVGNYTGIAQGFTVITGNHIPEVGKFFNDCCDMDERDVIIGDDVRIGACVTILPGVHIGRGAIIGAGAVLHNRIPPYAIALGNPARVIGFRMNPEEMLEHEKRLYLEEKRLSEKELFDNYEKYYFNRIEEIADFLK